MNNPTLTHAQIQELLYQSRLTNLLLSQPAKVSWLTATILAVGINFLAVPYVQKNNIPILTQALNDATEWETETAIDIGILAADTLTGEDRTVPALTAGQTMIGLTPTQSIALALNIRQTESTHDYSVINRYFYLGGFQQGASALAQVGLIKRANFEAAPHCVENGLCQKGFLMDAANWIIPGGFITFLRDKSLQDKAFFALSNYNIREGFRQRVLSKNSPPEKIAGFVKAAHLKGIVGAKKWYKYGIDSHDGNGTNVSDYARQAERAILALNNGV